MNKTKKDLYIENQKLKKEKAIYQEFWETEAIENVWHQYRNITKIILAVSVIVLGLSAILLVIGG